MIRRESYCGGRLVKEIDQIPVSRPLPGLPPRRHDGSARWQLDGRPVRPVEAEAFQTVWEAGRRLPRSRRAVRSHTAAAVAGGLIVWLITVLLAEAGWYGG